MNYKTFKSPAIIKFKNCVKKVMRQIRKRPKRKTQIELLMEKVTKLIKQKKEKEKEEEAKKSNSRMLIANMLKRQKEKRDKKNEEEKTEKVKEQKYLSVTLNFMHRNSCLKSLKTTTKRSR